MEDLKHSYTVVERAYKLKSASESMLKFAEFDMIISPDGLSAFRTFDMNGIDTIFELGYLAAKKNLEENGTALQLMVGQ